MYFGYIQPLKNEEKRVKGGKQGRGGHREAYQKMSALEEKHSYK